MKILVTGGSGQVGFELQRQLCIFGEVLAPTRDVLDLIERTAVETWLQSQKPDLIVNAAAYTAVDKAESEPTLANRLNAELPAQLATYARQAGIPLVHYSTDYVYPGDGIAAWKESSAPGPLSVYGASKLAGDQAVLASGCRHVIFRTSWVYAARGHNFMKTMLRLGRERNALAVVDDQVGAPTPARLIAQVTALALNPKGNNLALPSGLYHLAPRGETNWCAFAQEIFRQAAEAGEALALEPASVSPIPTSDYPTPASRPRNSRLALGKLEEALGIQLPDWQSQLALTLQEHLSR